MTPTGAIAVTAASDTARWSAFWRCFAYMKKCGAAVLDYVTYDVAGARNEAIEAADRAGAQWLMFLDDDHTFNPHILEDLLDRNVDIVQPIALRRELPFLPIQMEVKSSPPEKFPPTYHKMVLQKGRHGLVGMEVLGGGCLLIRRKVWETIPGPWFWPGQLMPGRAQEDVYFTQQAWKYGFTPYVDLDHPIGHCMGVEIWPKRMENGQWATVLRFGTQELALPATIVRDGQYIMEL